MNESCFQRIMREAIADGSFETFKELILDGVLVIVDGMTDEDRAIIESWMVTRVN